MRPLAKLLTKQIEQLRFLLRDQCLKDPLQYSDKIRQTFVKFDKTFADFELRYDYVAVCSCDKLAPSLFALNLSELTSQYT